MVDAFQNSMATTLIRAIRGGTAADNEGRLRLIVPASALAVDTTVTIVSAPVAPTGSSIVHAAWRIVVHPGPTVLSLPASLSVALPAGASADLRLLAAEQAVSLGGDWRALPAALAGQWLAAQVWHLPPSHGPPPVRSSMLICLAAGS